MIPDIKIVLFDVAGVLFLANKVVGEDIEATLGISQEEQMPMWRDIHREFSSGKIGAEQYLDGVAKLFKVDRSLVNEDLFTRSFLKALTPMPGINKLVNKLSENQSVKLAILSDTNPFHDKIRTSEGYYKDFDKVFLSYQIGYCKPDPRAFQTVIEYYNVDPKEIFFVDDNPANVTAARELGMLAEVFTSADNLEHQLVKLGVL